jgi:hypothetical protein
LKPLFNSMQAIVNKEDRDQLSQKERLKHLYDVVITNLTE